MSECARYTYVRRRANDDSLVSTHKTCGTSGGEGNTAPGQASERASTRTHLNIYYSTLEPVAKAKA
jgi:hypothetical protein